MPETAKTSTSFFRNQLKQIWCPIADVLAHEAGLSTLLATGASMIGSPVITAGYLQPGSGYGIELWGYCHTEGEDARFGSGWTIDGVRTQVIDTGVFATPANFDTTWWRYVLQAYCRTNGATGTLVYSGLLEIANFGAPTVNSYPLFSAATFTTDTTVGRVVEVFCDLESEDVDTFTVQGGGIYLLN